MDSFYYKKYLFYSSYCQGKMIYERNGFDIYPTNEYDAFVKAIQYLSKSALKVLDLGCGNALLLKHLMRFSDKTIIPYGVDFINKSISEAQYTVLPEYANNFICINATEYVFQDNFDLVLFDPSLFKKRDRNLIFKRIEKAHSNYCVVYTYNDVILKMGLTCSLDLLQLDNVVSVIYSMNTADISLALLKLNN